MRLLILSTEFPPGPGGIGTHAHQLALRLSQTGIELLVLTPQDYVYDKEIAAFNHAQPFRVRRLRHIPFSPFEAAYRINALDRAIRSFRPDWVMATGERSAWVAALVLKYRSIPWVAIGHGSEFGMGNRIERSATRWSFHAADAVVCVSRYTKTVMESKGIKPRATYVIHNGADIQRYKMISDAEVTSIRQKYDLQERFILLTVGNVTPRKGQEVVIRAMPEILKSIPNAIYIMVGLPTIKEKLEELALLLGVQDHVRFLGRIDVDSLVQMYQACDVFLMTSRHADNGDFEGFGIAVIEAALCGKPAIVSAGSGLEEAVLHNKTGIIVPENDPSATAQAVINLWHEERLRAEMGATAQQRAIQEHSWEYVAARYRAILTGQKGSSCVC